MVQMDLLWQHVFIVKNMENRMVNMVEVRSREQIAEVALLAQEIWQEHYVPIIGQEQVDYMLSEFQSEQAIKEQIADDYEYYLLIDGERNAGYVAVVPGLSDASLMLSKIYVKHSARGHGFGKRMLEYVEQLCRQRGIETIWLTVNKNNRDSIAWYQRMGFRNMGPTVQDIGHDFVMDDFRMEKTLPDMQTGKL